MGSFLNVLADRLSFDKSIMGRSHCDFCKKTLQWYDLLPVVSFISIRGKCRYCKKKLSIFYPLSELMTGIFFVLSWQYIPAYSLIEHIIYLGVVSCLIVIFLADVKYQIIPDQILVALGVLSLWFMRLNIVDHILGAAFLGSCFYMLYFLTKGKGLGFGDVKFAIVIGLLLGVRDGFLSIYLSFMIGGIIALVLLLLKTKKMKSKIAFGPFMIGGVFCVLFFHNLIYQYVNRLFG